MTDEKNSLLVNRVGGQLYQILADENALYAVHLGSMTSGASLRKSISDVSEYRPGPGNERIPRDEIEIVHIRRGSDQSEISMNTADGERTWRMNIRIPDEAVRMIFGGLSLICEEMDDGGETMPPDGLIEGDTAAIDAMDIPPIPGAEWILEAFAGALAVLLPSMLWLRQSGALFWLNLAYLPLMAVLMARCEGTRFARFSMKRLLMLLPGIGLTLMNVRLNLPDPAQIMMPSVMIALATALIYWILAGEKRSLRKAAAVLILVMLTYAPGAALTLNSLDGKTLRTSRVTPRLVRTDWIEAPLDGRQQRFYVHPDVCRKLSVNEPCELQLRSGAMGIEYWTAVPRDKPKMV